jgi:hypothetical protein
MREVLKRFAPQNFNDFLCLYLISLIVALWILAGIHVVELPQEVVGALIVTWTLLVQFYFRKAQGETKP